MREKGRSEGERGRMRVMEKERGETGRERESGGRELDGATAVVLSDWLLPSQT